MESAKKLVINIVTWNSARYLPNLFASIDAQTSDDFTVTVIDNASADDTLAWLQDARPGTAVLRNFRNQGFARAHNQGIALALSRWEGEHDLADRYIFLLNPDTILEPTCIAQVISFMDTHPDVDIAGPKLLRALRITDMDRDDEEVERTSVIDSTGISVLKSRKAVDRGAGEADKGQFDRIEPFGISGAAMVIRASAISDLAGGGDEVFDEDFFAYKEDADLSWRARLLGHRIALIPSATAWHCRTARKADDSGLRGAYRGQRERSSVLNRFSRRNQIWMEWKNDDTVSRLLHLPWRIPELLLRFGALIIFPSHLKAFIEAWMGRGRMQEKQKMIMARRKVSPEEMRALFT
jgi:GT2 family glycosyltransferase